MTIAVSIMIQIEANLKFNIKNLTLKYIKFWSESYRPIMKYAYTWIMLQVITNNNDQI